jgi:phospholipid/cholesterol/gamma-HCH transport system permease protein
MAPAEESRTPVVDTLEGIGRTTTRAIEQFGYGASLFWESIYWVLMGRVRDQRVRPAPVFAEAMEAGIRAIPIIAVLSMTIGIMLALQGIHALKTFGAQHQVVFGVALGITREFAPLITGILVAGRSGSALAARLATMTISQEVDALKSMGINPVRFLVAPSLIAMMVMVPALTLMADFVGLLGAGLYIAPEIDITMKAYMDQTISSITVDDVMHGLAKSAIFGVLITIVGIVDGSSVTGGAEGVGRVTTSSVVHGISAIVLTDMIFVFAATR